MGEPARKFDADFIKPFIDSTVDTLKVQCETEIKVLPPIAKAKFDKYQIDIAAVIALSSPSFKGSIAIAFPKQTFLKVMEGMLGDPYEEIDEDLEDGAGELLNIIFGGAKAVLNADNNQVEKAIPTVIKGDNLTLQHFSDAPAIVVPFNSPVGAFYMEIILD